MKLALVVAVGAVVVGAGGLAGSAQRREPSPTFDAASVKPTTVGGASARIDTTPGNVSVRNQTLRGLIVSAYGIREYQLDTSAAPSWIGTDRFDVIATMPRGTSPDQVEQMMQRLLADRFKVVVQRDMREVPVYALGLAREDRRLGPKLTVARDPTCAGPPSDAEREFGPRCGSVSFSPGQLAGRSVTWAQILRALSTSPTLGRLVIDGGAQPGLFDFELRWVPAIRPASAGPPPADLPDSIFTALQEQLGLQLNPATAPVPVVVVLSASQPEPN
jgi:uncharacterized protein (TIGR03435 family)